MTQPGRLAALGVVASTLLAITEILEWPVSLIVAVAAVFGWRLISGFWMTVAVGAAGGVLAGLVILGPGWRVVMRVVAVMDPSTVPELSLSGTMFVIGIGALIGAIFGIVGRLGRRAAGIQSDLVSGIVLGLVVTGALLVRFTGDFTGLGGGVWVNLSMFGTVSVVYAIVAMRLTDRFATKSDKQWNSSEDGSMPGSAPTLLSRQSGRG